MKDQSQKLEELRRETADLRTLIEEQGIRLTLAQAWIEFLHYAYDSLLAYGINYKALKEYDDHKLDVMADRPLSEARTTIIEYLRTARNGIRAAIRRKNFTTH